MKPIIKKVKNLLKISIAGVLLATTVFLSTSCSNVEYDSFYDTDEIDSIAEKMECDTGYLWKINDNYARMKHNGDEPIYVCFDEQLTEDEMSTAKEALEYVFGLLSKINEKYQYKIVDKKEYELKNNKTRIYFGLGQHDIIANGIEFASQGHIYQDYDFFSTLTDVPLWNDYRINIDREEIKKDPNPNALYYTNVHELMHACGDKDVYDMSAKNHASTFRGNTLINPNSGPIVLKFTPNDVKCKILLYAEKDADKKELKQILNDYTKEYYDEYVKKCEEVGGIKGFLNEEDFGLETAIRVTDEKGNKYGYRYVVEVNDGKYQFYLYEYYSNKLLDECKGDVVYHNGVAILTDLNLKHGFRPFDVSDTYSNGLIQDLIIGDYNGSPAMYDLFTNDVKLGKMYELEKNMVQ